MAAKRKRSTGSWEFIVQRKGLLPRPISLTFYDEAEGDQYVAHLETLLDQGIVPADFKNKDKPISTLGMSILAYIEAVHITADDKKILNALPVILKSVALDKVKYTWAEEWVGGLKASGLSPSTVRKKVGALARCLDWVVRREDTLLLLNPLRMLPKRYATTANGKRDQERDRRLKEGEEARINAILNKEKPEGRERAFSLPHSEAFKLMFTLALETAMRMREIYTLTVDQVDLKKRTIFLDKTKNGSKRQVPISSVSLVALTEYLPGLEGKKLFPFWDGSCDAEQLSASTRLISQQWRRVFEAAKCEGLHFHDLRHEATSRLYERTSLSDIQISLITGHKSLAMLRRYSNLRGSDLADRLW